VCNAVVLDPPGSPVILYSLHSPPRAIGTVAAASQAGSLLLSHLSPAVENNKPAVLKSIGDRYRGPTEFATDGLRLQP